MGWWEEFLGIAPETGERRKDVIDDIGATEAADFHIGAPAVTGLHQVKVPPPVEAATPSMPVKPPDQETPNSQREYDPRGRVNPPPMPHLGRRLRPPLPAETVVNVLSALQPIFTNAERFIRELPERLIIDSNALYIDNTPTGAGWYWTRSYPADESVSDPLLLIRVSWVTASSIFISHRLLMLDGQERLAGVNVWQGPLGVAPFATTYGAVAQGGEQRHVIIEDVNPTGGLYVHDELYPFVPIPPRKTMVWVAFLNNQPVTFSLRPCYTFLRLA